jgi:hypothetical protein
MAVADEQVVLEWLTEKALRPPLSLVSYADSTAEMMRPKRLALFKIGFNLRVTPVTPGLYLMQAFRALGLEKCT